jgi:hypothetical protein
MEIMLPSTGFSFFIPAETARIACVALGIYLLIVLYSPGKEKRAPCRPPIAQKFSRSMFVNTA